MCIRDRVWDIDENFVDTHAVTVVINRLRKKIENNMTCLLYTSADVGLSMGSRADEDSIAHELYRILRDCDELDVDVIFSESFSTPRIGQAIMNRMLKAAGHQVIDLSLIHI